MYPPRVCATNEPKKTAAAQPVEREVHLSSLSL